MIAPVSLLVSCQALGAAVGVFAAIWSELAYMRAMRDGRIDDAERAHLRIIGRGLRFGLLLLLLSSLGLVIAAYMNPSVTQPAVTTEYWTLTTLVFVVIAGSWALSRRRISFALGSAITFTAWWYIAFLTLGNLPALSFGSAVAFFVVAAALLFAILSSARFFLLGDKSGRGG